MACLLWRILSSFVRDTYRALGVLPSPLWGGVGGGGSAILSQVAPASSHRTTPTPAQRSQACAGCASLPACADPPHKGEGNDRARRASSGGPPGLLAEDLDRAVDRGPQEIIGLGLLVFGRNDLRS